MFSLDAYYPADSVGKLAVYLLGHASSSARPMDVAENGDAGGTAADDSSGADSATALLERLGDLLEQYYHPSNNGA